MSETSDEILQRLDRSMEVALGRLEAARPFAKGRHQHPVLDVAGRMLMTPGGVERLYLYAPRLDAAGVFNGSDWANPDTLQPQFVGNTFDNAEWPIMAMEAVSLLRMLAIAVGDAGHPGVHAESARHFLTQVLALNIRRFFGGEDEAARASGGRAETVTMLLRFLGERVGFKDILGALVSEIWRILAQRPVQTASVKNMVAQVAVTLAERGGDAGDSRLGADRLVTALFGPTEGSLDDPGVAGYLERVSAMDENGLAHEAQGFARAMHDTGLVSDYHAAFLCWAEREGRRQIVPEALGLTGTGMDCWRRYGDLVDDLIRAAVHPETPQAVYGLAMMMERGLLHHAPIAPALRRQMGIIPCAAASERLSIAYGPSIAPGAILLSGVLQVLGQPLGVAQGANPTCQSARAISMWALNDPDYLLHLIQQAARFDTVLMHFEGKPINSAAEPLGLAAFAPLDADPVSVVLVPHLDRVYAAMGRMVADRADDPHRWINPEFHGWWVGRECLLAVDLATGRVAGLEAFLRRFYAAYHPDHNGGEPVIHPQPAGVAVTDASARFVGWHAIAILRVAPDQKGVMRVYFYNPNNDSGQDWGAGVVVSTGGNGERHGEASLAFEDFAARLYLFHDDLATPSRAAAVPADVIGQIAENVSKSWAAARWGDNALAAVEA